MLIDLIQSPKIENPIKYKWGLVFTVLVMEQKKMISSKILEIMNV